MLAALALVLTIAYECTTKAGLYNRYGRVTTDTKLVDNKLNTTRKLVDNKLYNTHL